MKKITLVLCIVMFHFISFGQITLTLQPDALVGKDASIYSNHPALNVNNWDFIANAWTASGDSFVMRSFIDFDLAMIPQNSTILSAYLSLYSNTQSDHTQLHSSLSGSNQSELRRITSSWSESAVTWNNQPTTDTVNKITLLQSTSTTQNYLNIDVKTHIQQKVNNPASHFGFMLRLVTEYKFRCMVFASSDHTNASIRPKLVITYMEAPCPSYSFGMITLCQGDSVLLQGSYRKLPGVYFDTLLNIQNQDSIVVTALYINNTIHAFDSVQICNGDSIWIAGAYRKSQGFYAQTFTSAFGCDSVKHTQLKVIVLDSTVSVSGITLTANQAGATYQWIDCELSFTPIPGAVFQSYTPSINGSYAVAITKDGCTVISPCVSIGNVYAPGNFPKDKFKLIPNPGWPGTTTLLLDTEYDVTNIRIQSSEGNVIKEFKAENTSRIILDTSTFSSGVYFVKVSVSGCSIVLPLIIK